MKDWHSITINGYGIEIYLMPFPLSETDPLTFEIMLHCFTIESHKNLAPFISIQHSLTSV